MLLVQVSWRPLLFFLGDLALLAGDDLFPTIEANVGGLSQCFSFFCFFLLLFLALVISSILGSTASVPGATLVASICVAAVVVLLGLAGASPVVALCTANTSDVLSSLVPKLSLTVTIGMCPGVLECAGVQDYSGYLQPVSSVGLEVSVTCSHIHQQSFHLFPCQAPSVCPALYLRLSAGRTLWSSVGWSQLPPSTPLLWTPFCRYNLRKYSETVFYCFFFYSL